MQTELKGDYKISYFIMNKKEDAQPRKLTSVQPQTEVKGKVHPVTCNEGTEGEYRYSSTLYLTSALHVGATV
jgi:hypothetical protein